MSNGASGQSHGGGVGNRHQSWRSATRSSVTPPDGRRSANGGEAKKCPSVCIVAIDIRQLGEVVGVERAALQRLYDMSA